ncbi:MAG: ABC transporter permease [Geminicoccaceae bacterium]|nr:ABC transporter permease [Geminicoccaceae bacterium]MCS7269070.1 ABC transporter permease [Geminicoccaceae bacterium]MCX7630743.1 ABC transporter permease [Geminicoccaceae bacterium]MDW8125821.1 ABC transporter permease [Geminicoccaceae bacterium]MDW8342709.1 ABC transporter permease [Geminicoccaceae bacterium]
MLGSGPFARACLWGYALLVLAFLVLPILVILPLSFSAGAFLHFPLPGLSLRWYARLLEHEPWRISLLNSLIAGTIATVLATVLGTLAAVGLARARFPGRSLVMALVLAPMIVPTVILATGAYFFYRPLGLTGNLLGLAVAHTVLGAPFVVVTVSATLGALDPALVRAAQSLGAPPWLAFRKVTLPIIAPGVVSGALFAFVTSFDEVVVALFLTGPAQRTLPRQMFDGIREEINPEILAAATILVVLAVALLVTAELLRRRSARLRGIAP